MSGIIGVSPNMKSGVLGVFPVGHVIQTSNVFTNTTHTSVPADQDWIDTVITGNIITSDSSNSIIIVYEGQCYIHNTANDTGFVLRVKKVHSGGTSYPSNLMDTSTPTTYSTEYWNTDPGDHGVDISRTMLEDTCGLAGTITYTVQVKTRGGASGFVSCGFGGINSRKWRIWFQEVKR